jgi:hypothetical protein
MIEINSLRPVAIASVLLGISFAIAANYLTSCVWISFGTTIFLVEKVGIDRMNRLFRPEVFMAWVMFSVFIVLSFYQIFQDSLKK